MSAAAVQSGKCGTSPMKIPPFIAKLLIMSRRLLKFEEEGKGKPCNAMEVLLHKMQFLELFLLNRRPENLMFL